MATHSSTLAWKIPSMKEPRLQSMGSQKRWTRLSRYADDTTLLGESEELKGLLMQLTEESENFGLKLNIQKTKIMASSPITSWQTYGETVETVQFICWGSKITADG